MASDSNWKLALGWGPDLEAALAPYAAKSLEPARVILVSRKNLRVVSRRGEHWARTSGSLIHHADHQGEWPVVGDWVAARIPDSGEALVHAVLKRRTAFTRKVPGNSAVPQVLAANIDTVLIVMSLDPDYNVRRLERYLTLAWDSKAKPVVVLNKRDLIDDAELAEVLEDVKGISRDARLHVISALNDEGLEPLRDVAGFGQTIALLGSSGVGKSTLVNRLVGSDLMKTGDTGNDGKGRHTTTQRELLRLPSGGAIIDTPGLREVQLWEGHAGLGKTFDDIESLALNCRFSDCRHDAEPGCAVKAALEDETLPLDRFESWRELQKEIERLQLLPSERGRPETKRRARVGHGKSPKS